MNTRAITISGQVASGKSSLACVLVERLPGWRRVNVGQWFRDFCQGRGMTVQQSSQLADQVHREFDAYQLEMLHSERQVVVEGRLSGWLARELDDVLRVFCQAPIAVRVERYMGRDHVARSEALAQVTYRDEQDREKFAEIYGVTDYRCPSFYHLVLDTSRALPAGLAARVAQEAGLDLVPDGPYSV